jgi:maltooligosyltrehalose trehalohydrolase
MLGSAAILNVEEGRADWLATTTFARRLPIGAELRPDGGADVRVWAPRCETVTFVLESGAGESKETPLAAEPDGYFAGFVAEVGAGTRYRLRLDQGAAYPDPASRFQPDGPHGPSEIVDPAAFVWSDGDWDGVGLRGAVIYELHVGTFTTAGTWDAARRELPALHDLGVTVIEVMPIAEFPGQFGWGYDGVNLFAPSRLYGRPDDVRQFIDDAHRLGIGVILDLVYNHLGPDGNYLAEFSDDYRSKGEHTEWGDAFNFDRDGSGPVREMFVSNARYWIDEFHFDGCRLDATQQIFDDSDWHIIAEVTAAIRQAARHRQTIVIAENERQNVQLVASPAEGGYGLDGLWNDDFHHSATVALTGRNEAYYSQHRGTPQEFVSAAKHGFLYQGQYYAWQEQARGTSALGRPPEIAINYLQNHDQVANSARGSRIHHLTDASQLRALTALLLLSPGTPMLFQGQEFASSSPFHYFADHTGELAGLVVAGRADSFRQFPSVMDYQESSDMAVPTALSSFTDSKLDHSERERNRATYVLHRDLLRIRRDDPVFRLQAALGIDGAVIGDEALVLRFFGVDGDDRLLLINLGRDVVLLPMPEPLLAPSSRGPWRQFWSSEEPRYGGSGTPPFTPNSSWRLAAHSAVVLLPDGDV